MLLIHISKLKLYRTIQGPLRNTFIMINVDLFTAEYMYAVIRN
jgi:hypothetical protein